MQLVVDLLAHALDLALQHPRLLAFAAALLQAFAHPLQHRQRRLQAVRQVIERIAVTLALLAFAAQQAVQRAGQAQQLTRVLTAQAIARTRLHLVQFATEPAQRAQAPGQPGPQQHQQHQQGRAKTEVELFAQAVEGMLVLAHRLQGDNTVGRALAAQQLDLDIVDEELLAIGLANARELITAAIVTRVIVDVLRGGGPRLPDQVAVAIEDIAKQPGVRQVVALVRQQRRHL